MDTEALIERARLYWEQGFTIPLDLFVEMNNAGLDVETLEDKYFD
jgi:hypothetical protein